jgi:hypothetical protein
LITVVGIGVLPAAPAPCYSESDARTKNLVIPGSSEGRGPEPMHTVQAD